MFDVVADIESYPRFLPGWVHARILERDGERVRVSQSIGLLGRSLSFSSNACLQRPRSLRIDTEEPPFRSLSIRWEFEPLSACRCRVHFEVSLQMRASLLDGLMELGFERFAARIVGAFESEAARRYARERPLPTPKRP